MLCIYILHLGLGLPLGFGMPPGFRLGVPPIFGVTWGWHDALTTVVAAHVISLIAALIATPKGTRNQHL